MPTLRGSNGFSVVLPGLGKNRCFKDLSEKRITMCTREALRKQYGERLDFVSCDATFVSPHWRGKFGVDGQQFAYLISTL
jgi:hypothetical protein